MVYRGEYDPYGNLVYEWGSAGLNPRKFTGYERDATGLDYANARMYGPGRGRFMQPDPLGLGGANKANPQSLNRYSYVQNDPVNFVDKSGKLLGAPDGPSAGGSECRSTFVAVDWTSDTVGTGFISYGFTYRFCVYSSGGEEVVGFQDVYNDLTRDEKLLCITYPEVCSRVNQARKDALKERQKRYGPNGDNDDWCDNAFLHAYWNARMVQLISMLPSDIFYTGFTALEMAKAFADAHEARPNNPVVEQRMDFWNNNVGRIIASQNPYASPTQLADLVQNEVNAGRVLVMDNNGVEPRHPRSGECDPND